MQPSLFTPTSPTAIQAPRPLFISELGRYRRNSNKVVDLDELQLLFSGKIYLSEKKGEWYLNQNEYWFWDRNIECGRSYMVGDTPLASYLRTYTYPLKDWQKLAYQWAIENPRIVLHLENTTRKWRVFLRGEFVEFSLPYQSWGGERNYVTRTGETMVQVNED